MVHRPGPATRSQAEHGQKRSNDQKRSGQVHDYVIAPDCAVTHDYLKIVVVVVVVIAHHHHCARLRRRLLQCDAEHFGLDRGAELNPATPVGVLNQARRREGEGWGVFERGDGARGVLGSEGGRGH